jgi:hypothetical protein
LHNSGVHPCGVAIPDIKVQPRNGLAGVDIDELCIEENGDTWLVLAEIRPNIFSKDVELEKELAFSNIVKAKIATTYWPYLSLRVQNASPTGLED